MNNLCIQELAEVVGGRLRLGSLPPLGGDLEPVGRVVVDSRQVREGDVFWGLPGQFHDGSRFAEEAFVRGASGVVVSGRRIEPWAGRFAIEVEDSRCALWQLAIRWREDFPGRVIAVADDNDGSRTARMIEAVLGVALRGATCCHIRHEDSLPVALLDLQDFYDFGILPLQYFAANGIRSFLDLTRPEVAVISDFDGDDPTIAAAARELLSGLPEDAIAVLNGDNPALRELSKTSNANVLWLGRAAHCDLHFDATVDHNNQPLITIDGERFRLPPGDQHDLKAAFAAIALGRLFDLSMTEIRTGLSRFRPLADHAKETTQRNNAGVTARDHILKALPIASVLREIDATLPPG